MRRFVDASQLLFVYLAASVQYSSEADPFLDYESMHCDRIATHVSLIPVFTVPKGKMEEFTSNFGEFYNKTRRGTKECLYYGFARSGDRVMCREGYTSADGVLQHLKDVKAPFDMAVRIVGEGGQQLWAVGPKNELDKLRPSLAPMGTIFWDLDKNAF